MGILVSIVALVDAFCALAKEIRPATARNDLTRCTPGDPVEQRIIRFGHVGSYRVRDPAGGSVLSNGG
jgi:hypothetical protein